jgi:hypothetical protein
VGVVGDTLCGMTENLQGRDKAQYTRQQKGHSLILHLLFGGLLLYIPTIYFAVSKNHYFHA